MDTSLYTAILVVLLAGTAVLAFLFYSNKRRHRELLEFLAKRVEELEDELTRSRDVLDNGSQKFSDQARRIAWLESRVRNVKGATDGSAKDETLVTGHTNDKWSVTEKRHKVLSLANRGYGAESIAATLGMMRGEVELIINLGRAASAGAN